jgi:alkanesulfonate monooxygenase SsuD/methylene tetrahydromethanopterin reductase-like flavin-dependent oxidoreductase (luciferase family)
MDVGVGLWQMRSTAAAPASFPMLYRELQEDARLAEDLGFHSLWLSEHHFWYDGWCPSLLVAGAAALGATERLRIGTGVFLVPLHDPDRIAAAGLALQRLAPGRFEMGIGLGYREPELDAFGISRKQRGRRADSALDLLATSWAGGGPSLWLGGIAEKSLRRAAERGLSLFLPSTMRNDQIQKAITLVREVAAERAVEPGRIGVLKNAWLTDDDAEEQRVRLAIGRAGREYGGAWWLLRGAYGFDEPDLLDAQAARAAESAFVGSAAEVATGIRDLEALGVDLVALHVAADFTRPAYREMMRRMAADLLPQVG